MGLVQAGRCQPLEKAVKIDLTGVFGGIGPHLGRPRIPPAGFPLSPGQGLPLAIGCNGCIGLQALEYRVVSQRFAPVVQEMPVVGLYVRPETGKPMVQAAQ